MLHRGKIRNRNSLRIIASLFCLASKFLHCDHELFDLAISLSDRHKKLSLPKNGLILSRSKVVTLGPHSWSLYSTLLNILAKTQR